jgi:hypothetical protein
MTMTMTVAQAIQTYLEMTMTVAQAIQAYLEMTMTVADAISRCTKPIHRNITKV